MSAAGEVHASIPISEPWLDEPERRNVLDCLSTGWIGGGRYVEQLESQWSAYCGMRHGVAVANGTVALELALAAAALPRRSEVILPSFTIISTLLAVVRNGLTPVLVDAEPGSWSLDVDQVRHCVSERTSAIMPVHMYGHPAEMEPLLQIADEHGLVVVEDAAQAHGSEYRMAGRTGVAAGEWRRCGGLGHVSCFSFYSNKVITCGEGGMVLTSDKRIARRAGALRNLAFGRRQRFRHAALGFNYRLSNLQAAVAAGQVERIDEILAGKRRIGLAYRELLAAVPGVTQQRVSDRARPNWWVTGLVLDDAVPYDARELARRLERRGIATRPFFLGMHEQPPVRRRGWFEGERFPVTERLARRGLYLPSSPRLTQADCERVVGALREELSGS